LSVAHTWGSTAEERVLEFPCDGCLSSVDTVLFRAVDVNASEAVIFRWLCQLRVAPYSYDWIDNLGRRSPRTLTAGMENLEVGQRVMTIFELVSFARDRHLTLVMRHRRSRKIFGDIAVTYLVRPGRLVVKLVGRCGPWWKREALAWGDLIMTRKQLLTLKRLMEEADQNTS
jgi:hypothetical protein